MTEKIYSIAIHFVDLYIDMNIMVWWWLEITNVKCYISNIPNDSSVMPQLMQNLTRKNEWNQLSFSNKYKNIFQIVLILTDVVVALIWHKENCIATSIQRMTFFFIEWRDSILLGFPQTPYDGINDYVMCIAIFLLYSCP